MSAGLGTKAGRQASPFHPLVNSPLDPEKIPGSTLMLHVMVIFCHVF